MHHHALLAQDRGDFWAQIRAARDMLLAQTATLHIANPANIGFGKTCFQKEAGNQEPRISICTADVRVTLPHLPPGPVLSICRLFGRKAHPPLALPKPTQQLQLLSASRG